MTPSTSRRCRFGLYAVMSAVGGLLVACSGGDGDTQRVTPGAGATQAPATCEPLPDLPRGRLAYTQTREDGTTAVFVMKPDGTDRRCVVDTAGLDGYPNWSPDGKWLTFIGGNVEGEDDVFVVLADGTRLRRLTSSAAIETHPVWSPDGSRIAYTAEDGVDGPSSIHVMARDGSADSVAISQSAQIEHPEIHDWAPDGDTLLFGAYGEASGMWTVRPDGTGRHFLGGGPGDYGSGATYSPNGRTLVFQADLDGGCIYRSDADVRHVVRLTQGCQEGFDLTWSPDSRWIAWAGGSHGPADAQVMASDGSQVHTIADGSDVAYIDWQPTTGD